MKPYDPFDENNLINGNKITMVWHVDGIKVRNYSKKIVTRIVKWLKKTYERHFEDESGKMNISRGKIIEYLGMK